MSINESRIRQIIRQEASRALAGRKLHESYDDGRWFLGENGYDFEGMPELEQAWARFTQALGELGEFSNMQFEDSENDRMMDVGQAIEEQIDIIIRGN